mgnify:CR=1 FL=1
MFDFEKTIIQSQAQAIILQLENDFPENEEEQARHAREYTVAYFGRILLFLRVTKRTRRLAMLHYVRF